MDPFVTLAGVAAPLYRENVSTDALIPSRLITSIARTGYGPKLLGNERYLADGSEDPAHVLNRPEYRESCILIAGANFGCGSSREMAVWAVKQFGFRCIIAPSFAPIFRKNCLTNGVLPLTLPAELVQQLAEVAEHRQSGWIVDLRDCSVTAPGGGRHAFEIDREERQQLLLGLDPIGVTLAQADKINAFIEADRKLRPWIWISRKERA